MKYGVNVNEFWAFLMRLYHDSKFTSATFADEIEKEEWKIYKGGNTGRYLPR